MEDRIATATQMRAVEAAAFAAGATAGELMERAGRGAVEAILAHWPDLARRPGRAVVLCGPGSNGGDGYVVACLLAGKGWSVKVRRLGASEGLPPAARANHDRWWAIGPVRDLDDAAPWDPAASPDLVVDALFGIGLARPLVLPAGLARGLAACPRVAALDLPSGLDAETGRRFGGGEAIRADLTTAFGHPKPGHVLAEGPSLCGALVVVDIGLRGRGGAGGVEGMARLVGRPRPPSDGGPWAGDKARPDRPAGAHKYDHGHALVLAGGFGRTGAARLAARAALRIGAGLVTVAASGAAMLECATQLTAIMLRRCDDGAGLTALLEDARLDTLCLGPGLGTEARAAGLLEAALAARRATVLDADALTLLARRPAPFAGLHGRCVLTSHAGEFARLFPDLADRLAGDGEGDSKLGLTREAAARAGCVVLLKGPDTVIADPSGEACVHVAAYDRAAPWLATAGTGDVLAGMVAGLLARGLPPMEAAAQAVWCHVEAALAAGAGMIAEDLPEALPRVLAGLALEG